ncbi:MAG: hypothetical protein ACRD3J_15515 [Thermoanaerobaculia bacterium]
MLPPVFDSSNDHRLNDDRQAVMIVVVPRSLTIRMHLLFAIALTIKSLQGHWISARYADALASMRSPSRAEKVDPAIAITINGNRADATSFHEGSWRIIKSVDEQAIVVSPLEAPDGKAERLPLTVTHDAHGAITTIRVALWPETMAAFRRIDVDAETYARRVLLAGTYRDAKGAIYRFTEGGQLTIGKGPARPYHVSLDTSEACCDYFVIGEEDRAGFQWRDGKLLLYKIIEDPNGCPISCAKTPYATLTVVH